MKWRTMYACELRFWLQGYLLRYDIEMRDGSFAEPEARPSSCV